MAREAFACTAALMSIHWSHCYGPRKARQGWNHLATMAGIADTAEEALDYLRFEEPIPCVRKKELDLSGL
jgi:hypothetical protein